ncbi:MAG: hypothetical protein NT069_21425 [Planctomycetota bacterium]|nr:hypothetical protein [Planctomycetota bacterium]
MQIYAQNVVGEHEPRVAAFLKEGLWRKPISVPWHRAYQNLDSVAANEAALVPEYDAQLAQAPGDAMLLYLRGRVGLDRADQLKYYQLADAKDPQLGWPAMGLAFDAANRGDWGEAKRLCEKGAGPLSNDPSYRYLWHLVRLAVGEAGAQEPFYRQQIQSPDLVDALQTVYQLADCLAAQGKFNDARQAVNQWMANTGLARSPETVARFQSMLDYVCGDLDPVRLKNGNPPSLPTRDIDLLLARGEPDRVAKIDGFQTAFDGWSEMLSMSLAYSLVRNRVEADRWRGLACDKLRTGDGDMRRAADLLTRETPPTDAELDGIVLRLHEVPVFLCALAQKFPERKTELNQRAAKLNISRQAPYLLVKRAVGMP